jgi:hypothetical protein
MEQLLFGTRVGNQKFTWSVRIKIAVTSNQCMNVNFYSQHRRGTELHFLNTAKSLTMQHGHDRDSFVTHDIKSGMYVGIWARRPGEGWKMNVTLSGRNVSGEWCSRSVPAQK